MKYALITVMLVCVCDRQAMAGDPRVALFDSKGKAVAFIDTEGDLTIYSMKGKPLAYLAAGSVWGFNGKHLGWFSKGIIRDHDGYVVGCVRNAVPMRYRTVPPKGYKRLAPHRRLRKHLPPRGPDKNKWSTAPLSHFLAVGRK